MLTEQEKTDLLGADEFTSFMIIDECGAFVWSMNHEISHDRIPKDNIDVLKDIDKMKEVQQLVAENLTKFGVNYNTHNKEDGEYWKWYGFWKSWRDDMPEEEWNNIAELISLGEEYSDYLPTKTWKD